MINQKIIDHLKNNFQLIEGIKSIKEFLPGATNEGAYPFLVVRDPKDRVTNNNSSGMSEHLLHIEIDIVTSPNEETAKDLRSFIEKVQKVFGESFEEDGFYYPNDYHGRDIVDEKADYIYFITRMSFTVEYSTEKYREA